MIQVNGATGLEIGRATGGSGSERLGDAFFVQERGNGNYFIESDLADPGGIVNAGSLYLVDGASGTVIDTVDGTQANERLSNDVDYFISGNDDAFVISRDHMAGGFASAGTIVQVAAQDLDPFPGVNIIRGRVDGGSANERLGNFGIDTLFFSGNFTFVSPSADPGSVVDAGTVYFYDPVNATLLGQVNGTSTSEFLGNFGIIERGNGNVFLRSPGADPGGVGDAGTLYLADASGTLLGTQSGNAPNEQFSSSGSFFGTEVRVQAPQHNNGAIAAAGGFFGIADVDLGGGNILNWQLLGTSANEQLGGGGTFLQPITGSSNLVVNSPNADPGGIIDAGTFYFFNPLTNTLVNRIDGTSANERLSNFGFFQRPSGNLFIPTPNADPGGVVDAGSIVLASPNGVELGRLDGNATNERLGSLITTFFLPNDALVRAPLHDNGGLLGAGAMFSVMDTADGAGNITRWTIRGESAGEGFGNFFPTIHGDTLLVRSPDADISGLIDAGSVRQFDINTGALIRRVDGVSADERLGAFFPTTLSDGRLLFRSPDADVSGVVDAGRIVLFDPTGASVGGGVAARDLLFGNNPAGDFIITNGSIKAALANGGRLILQANNDIIVNPGVDVIGAGRLELNAGRSIVIHGRIGVDELLLVSDADASLGALAANRDSGIGALEIDAGPVALLEPPVSDALFSDQLFTAFFENANGFGAPAAFAMGISLLDAQASNIFIRGGGTAGSFAALGSLGQFVATTDTLEFTPGTGTNADAVVLALGGLAEITFGTCTGCTDLLFDPLTDTAAQSGIFISGLFEEPSINAILAMLNRDEDDQADDDDDDDDDDEAGMCSL